MYYLAGGRGRSRCFLALFFLGVAVVVKWLLGACRFCVVSVVGFVDAGLVGGRC